MKVGLLLKILRGVKWTVRNHAYVFHIGRYYVFHTDEEQNEHTRWKDVIEPLTIIKCRGDCELVAKRLNHQVIVQRGRCDITAEQVETKIRKALDNGAYRREGKRLVTLFWVVDTFLNREPISEKSQWITLSNSNIKDYMQDSSEKLMKSHIKFTEPYPEDLEEMKQEIEKSLYEKLKDRLKEL